MGSGSEFYTGTVITGSSKDVLGDCAQGVIVLHIASRGGKEQWMRDCSVMLRFIIPKTIYTCDKESELDMDHLAGTHYPWLVLLWNPSDSTAEKTLEIEPHHRLSSYDVTQVSLGTSSLNWRRRWRHHTAFGRGARCFQNCHDWPPQSEKCAKNPSASRSMRRKRVEREAIHGPLRLATLVKHPGDHVPLREQEQSAIQYIVPSPGKHAGR